MVRIWHLFIGTAACIGLVVLPSIPVEAAGCGFAQHVAGCTTVDGNVKGGSVELDGSATRPEGHSHGGGGAALPATPRPPRDGEVILRDGVFFARAVVRDGYTVTSPPAGPEAVTVNDLVNFTPVAAVDNMEPNGWAVIGLDTNFYAAVAVQTEQGLLLGQAASVRFTPVRFRWSYGDGTTGDRSSGGASWAAQGIAEFEPTNTSHVFTKAGNFTITLSVEFAPEYQFAGGQWIGIRGVVPSAANELRITAGNAKTVLVERDCQNNPSGPGC